MMAVGNLYVTLVLIGSVSSVTLDGPIFARIKLELVFTSHPHEYNYVFNKKVDFSIHFYSCLKAKFNKSSSSSSIREGLEEGGNSGAKKPSPRCRIFIQLLSPGK